MKRLLFLFAIFAAPLFAQQQVQPVAGVLTLSLAPGVSSFKTILSANITSVVFTNPTPGTTVTVIFTENATGGFTVTFGGNITNPCSVTTTASTPTVCTFTFDASSNSWIGGGGSGGGSGPAGPGYITATSFGVTGAAQSVCDATFVSTSATITTPSTDPAFTAANVGNIEWGSAVSCGGNSNGVPNNMVAQGTILTLNSAHNITVSIASTGNCTPTLSDNCPFVWGPDHTTQLQAAWTALGAACPPGVLVLPAGGIIIQSPPVTTSNCGPAPGSGSPTAGFTVQG